MLALTSCSTGTEATKAPEPAPAPPPPGLQANQRTPCPELPLLQSSALPALLSNHDQVTGLYHDCKAQNASLLQAADEWEQTAWAWYCRELVRIGAPPHGCPPMRKGPDPPAR